MITVILLLRDFIENKTKKGILKNYRKRTFFMKTVLPKIYEYCNNLFIFRYDDLMELYKLLENSDSEKVYLLDDEYDYITIILEEKGILKIRIDIGLSTRTIKLSIEEVSLQYSMKYEFKDRIRFKNYHDETKDKDQQLISISNDLLVFIYSTLLQKLFWDQKLTDNDLGNIAISIKNNYDYNRID